MSNKLAVLFPGIGYTNDKPLLYYSGKLAKELGYDTIYINYDGFPDDVRGDQDKMTQCFDIALEQSKRILETVDWSGYDRIVFISKSIGTVVAVNYARNLPCTISHVLLTPLSQTFYEPVGEAIAFHGTADPWADTVQINAYCLINKVPLTIIPDANHSLETDHVLKNITIVKKTIKAIKKYLS